MCAHIVAVAMTNGDLQKLIDWHSKQQHGINVTSLAESGLPVISVGKKASKRKGVSKKKSAKISEGIDGASHGVFLEAEGSVERSKPSNSLLHFSKCA